MKFNYLVSSQEIFLEPLQHVVTGEMCKNTLENKSIQLIIFMCKLQVHLTLQPSYSRLRNCLKSTLNQEKNLKISFLKFRGASYLVDPDVDPHPMQSQVF